MARFKTLGRRTFSGRKPYVLFLCTGNTCRSPMAYGVLRHIFEEEGIDGMDIRTAGVMTIPGLLPTQECRQILLKDGIDIEHHRSCQLTSEMVKKAELVLGMTSFHVQMALRMTDDARGKTYLLKEYAGSDPRNSQIQDPMGCTLEVYKKVFRDIRAACRRLAKRLEEEYRLKPGAGKPRGASEAKRPARKPAEKKPLRIAPEDVGSLPGAKPAPNPAAEKTAPEKPVEKAAEKPAPKKTEKKTTKPASKEGAAKASKKKPAGKSKPAASASKAAGKPAKKAAAKPAAKQAVPKKSVKPAKQSASKKAAKPAAKQSAPKKAAKPAKKAAGKPAKKAAKPAAGKKGAKKPAAKTAAKKSAGRK